MSTRALLAGIALLSVAPRLAAVGFENHRIIARRAIEVLPPPLAPLFESNREAFEERAVEPFAVWPADPEMRGRQSWTWVGLDLEATEQTRPARLKAAERFPRTESRARKAYREHQWRNGGTLPWVVETLFHQLVSALREGEEEDVVRLAGHLAYFAGCCASPFGATCNHDGQLSRNLYFGSLKVGDDRFADQSIRHRFDLELVRRNGARYQTSIKLSASDYDPVAEPVGRAFEALLDSLGCVDEVLAADREILARLQASDAATFSARADEYYALLDERCGGLCADRLRAGAVLAGSLIGGAWEQAGRPGVAAIRSRGATTSAPADSASQPVSDRRAAGDSAWPFVGSKGSRVFHRADCPHVQRIEPENRVYFKTPQEALDQGRRPCKTCNPS